MSLSRVSIRNFQSLRSVDLDIGAFTVIVGPSSSGKSALMRACRAVASNVRGAGIITRGQKQMAITYASDTGSVTLERTEKAGTYRLHTPATGEQVYTKLAGDVPADVTAALGLQPVPVGGTSVNFASQFDRPFLLAESGAVVARVLGELTNVNTIFEAVRTANKVRLSASGTLKTRQGDLQALKGRLLTFKNLPQQVALFEQTEKLYADSESLTAKISRLDSSIRALRIAERAIAKAAAPFPVPSPDRLDEVLTRYLDLRGKQDRLLATRARLVTCADALQAARTAEAELTRQLADALHEAKVCPTCGQGTV